MRLTSSDLNSYPDLPNVSSEYAFVIRVSRKPSRELPRQVIRRLEEHHEQTHLETFPSFIDLSKSSIAEEVRKRTNVLYRKLPQKRHH